MTFGRLEELQSYWSEFPPAHIIAAAKVGLKPKKKGTTADLKREVLEAGGRVVSTKKA